MIGLLQPVKASFKRCKEIKCQLVYHCSKKSPLIAKKECIKPNGIDALNISLPTEKQPSYVGEKLIHNLITNWYKEAVIEDTFGVSTVNKKITHIALSCHADYPDENSILENEIGRVEFTERTATGLTGVVESLFNLSDANTLTANITDIVSTTEFELDDVTGLHIGDGGFFEVETLKVPVKILDINTNVITIDEPVAGTPTIFHQEIGRIYLLANATNTPGTGDPVSIAQYKDEKTSSDTLGIVNNIMVS